MGGDTLLRGLGCAVPVFLLAILVNACGDGAASQGQATACTDGDPSRQHQGGTCVCCHAEFGAAGSVDPNAAPVAQIVVTDARGEVATMSPNAFSNFFRHFSLVPPLRARVIGVDGTSLEMAGDAPTGDCNACHAVGARAAPLHGP